MKCKVKVYKIRNKDGLFANKKVISGFTETGGIFTLSGLKTHLGNVYKRGRDYDSCEVVEYDLIEASVSRIEKFSSKNKTDE